MQVETYWFRVGWVRDGLLPDFKGAALRGAMGYALRGTTCRTLEKPCRECMVNTVCVYSRLFEEKSWGRPKSLRMSAPPHPMVLLAPEDEGRFYPKGTEMVFGLRFFGDYRRDLPYAALAVKRMGRQGLARELTAGVVSFTFSPLLIMGRISGSLRLSVCCFQPRYPS